jgi:hypothetical protein
MKFHEEETLKVKQVMEKITYKIYKHEGINAEI